MIKAITPLEARKGKVIPEFVLKAVNELIQEKIGNSTIINFKQSELMAKLLMKKHIIMEDDLYIKLIYDHHWLDFEGVYRDAGWHVVYDSPAYNESYEANFTFSTA